jgi:hypothetical protein
MGKSVRCTLNTQIVQRYSSAVDNAQSPERHEQDASLEVETVR